MGSVWNFISLLCLYIQLYVTLEKMMNEINFFVSNFVFLSSALVFRCWAPWGSKSGFPRNLEEVWDLQPQNPSLVHPSLLHHHQTLASTPSPRFFFQRVADHQDPSPTIFKSATTASESIQQIQEKKSQIRSLGVPDQLKTFRSHPFFYSGNSLPWVSCF